MQTCWIFRAYAAMRLRDIYFGNLCRVDLNVTTNTHTQKWPTDTTPRVQNQLRAERGAVGMHEKPITIVISSPSPVPLKMQLIVRVGISSPLRVIPHRASSLTNNRVKRYVLVRLAFTSRTQPGNWPGSKLRSRVVQLNEFEKNDLIFSPPLRLNIIPLYFHSTYNAWAFAFKWDDTMRHHIVLQYFWQGSSSHFGWL